MKIFQVSPPYIDTPPINYGGTELIVDILTEGLVKRGHDVTLFATKNSKTSAKLEYVFNTSLVDQKVDWIHALPPLYHYGMAIKFAEKENFDLIHFHISADVDVMLLQLMSNVKIPCVATNHGSWPFDKATSMDNYYIKSYGPGINIINISHSMQKEDPDEFNKLGVVYNAINVDQFEFNDSPENYLTWIGKIVPWKGVDIAINIAKKASEKFIFAGMVDIQSKVSFNYFKEKVEPLIDNNQIIFLGPADMQMKNKMLKNSKGFLNPINGNRKEAFGLVMAESMACGTPVISLRNGAVEEVIEDNVTGFIVDSNEEMKNAIGKLGTVKRADCRQRVIDNFSPDAMVENYIQIYNKFLN